MKHATAWRASVWVLGAALAGTFSLSAQGFSVDGSGNVDANSFTGSGTGLTGVPTTITHDYFEESCPTATTCVVTKACPASTEVSGGGFFINSGNQSLRSQVSLHQTYRATVTQWTVEATNNSGQTLGFGVVPECVLVPDPPDEAIIEGRHPFDHYQLLLCPQGEHSKYITGAESEQAHYCPHHGEQMLPYGVRRYPVEIAGDGSPQSTED